MSRFEEYWLPDAVQNDLSYTYAKDAYSCIVGFHQLHILFAWFTGLFGGLLREPCSVCPTKLLSPLVPWHMLRSVAQTWIFGNLLTCAAEKSMEQQREGFCHTQATPNTFLHAQSCSLMSLETIEAAASYA